MYILTQSGRHFDYTHPVPGSVVIEDIAHALAHINRFTGHTRYPYSVAQHSVAVADYLATTGCPLPVIYAGLLHDAHEAYFGDINTVLKAELGVKADEDRIQAFVLAEMGLTLAHVHDRRVKLADLTALAVEKDALLPPDIGNGWACLAPVTPAMCANMKPIRELPPGKARRQFLDYYHNLARQLAYESVIPNARPKLEMAC